MLEAAGKAILYASLLTLLGACTASWLLRTHPRGLELGAADGMFARLGLAAAAFTFALLLYRLMTHTVAVFGMADAWSWESVSIVGFQSRWGGSWRVQMTAASICVLSAAWFWKKTATLRLLLVTLTAVSLCSTFPLAGHAAGSTFRHTVATLHMLGAGAWLGTLAALWFAGDAGGPLFRRFSPLALSGAALAVASGLTMGAIYLAGLGNLWTTGYGRLLALKTALFLVACRYGYVNWRHVRAGERAPVVTRETVLAAVIVLVTAFLTEMEHP